MYVPTVHNVFDAAGRRLPIFVSREGRLVRIRIGSQFGTVSGKQTYRIRYEVSGVPDPFPEHDELYWNVNGEWPCRPGPRR